MRKLTKYLIAGAILLAGWIQAPESFAGPAEETSATQAMGILGQALSDDLLDTFDGREDVKIDRINMQVTEVSSNPQLANNILSATGSTLNNGANSIGQSAFSNANGIVTVIQNSGNQVLIQNDMVLNLFTK